MNEPHDSKPTKGIPYAERMKRKRYKLDLYERCLARFLIARQMIRLGDLVPASEYISKIDEEILEYASHLRKREYEEDSRGLKFLVRYVYLEIESLTEPPKNGERRELDRHFYMSKITRYGW